MEFSVDLIRGENFKDKQYTYDRDVVLCKAKINEILARWLWHDQALCAQPVVSRKGEIRRNHGLTTSRNKNHDSQDAGNFLSTFSTIIVL